MVNNPNNPTQGNDEPQEAVPSVEPDEVLPVLKPVLRRLKLI